MDPHNTEKKKALLFLHAGAEWYGADKVLYNTVAALKNAWECHVLLPNDGVLVEKLTDLGVTVGVFSYPILRRKFFTLAGIAKFVYEYLLAILGLVLYTRKNKIAGVYSHTFAVTEGVALAVSGIPHVWHVLEIITRPAFLNRLLSFSAIQTTSRIICASKAVQINLGSPANSTVIYHGIEPLIRHARPRTLQKETPVVIGMLGRFNHWKGQDHLVQAVRVLIERGTFSYTIGKVLMVGGVFENDTTALKKVVSLIDDSPQHGVFEIRDFTENIASVYNEIDLYVLPSTLPDPFPTVVLEAMSMGIPVVGYRHGGIVEMLDANPVALAEPCNIGALAAVMDLVLSDDAIYNSLARSCLQKFTTYYNRQAFQTAIQSTFQSVL